MKQDFVTRILDYLFPYDPDKYRVALPRVETREKLESKHANEVRDNRAVHVTKHGQVFTIDKLDLNAATEQSEWNERKNEQTRAKHAKVDTYLTDEDIREMKARGLWNDTNKMKAENIKPLFAMNRSRSEIVEAFKGTRGYSDGSIWPLLACFTRSLEKAAQSCAE